MAIIVGGLLIALQLVVREIAEDSSAASSGAGVEEHDGFTAIAERPFLKSFANGADRRKAETQFAVQQPDAATLFGERTTAAAWHSKSSWYAVSSRDQTINPDLQRFLAQRMN